MGPNEDTGKLGNILDQKRYFETHRVFWPAMAMAPGISQLPAAGLFNTGRRCEIISVTWNLLIMDNTNNLVVPWEENDEVQSELLFGTFVAGAIVATDMYSIAPPVPSVGDRRIHLFKPGQYFFKGLFFQNDIEFDNNFVNMSLVRTFSVYSEILVELERIYF